MSTQENARTEGPQGVERDSEQPLAKKPSVLFIASVSIGVLTILLIAAYSYFGVAQ